MKKEDIVTLDDNKDYLVLDVTELEDSQFLYTVELDEDNIPTTNYKYLEVIEDEDTYVEEVEDKDLLETIVGLFTINYLGDSIEENGNQDV